MKQYVCQQYAKPLALCIVLLSVLSLSLGCQMRTRNILNPTKNSVTTPGYCMAKVSGIGTIDIENTYLPRVVACEHARASSEAKKAQAIAARSYLYYKLARNGTISDSERDQVYSCGRLPQKSDYKAVADTRGSVILYQGKPIAGFYVAGSVSHDAACRGKTAQSSQDPTKTEQFVTYNQGRVGREVTQTNLGYVHPQNYANRGCLAQNGSQCLAKKGKNFLQILQFYYGEDITIAIARLSCH